MSFEKTVRNRSSDILSAHGIPMHPNLPLLQPCSLRAAESVAQRIVATYALAGLVNGADAGALKDWLVEDQAWNFLSKSEQSFFDLKEYSEAQTNELSWHVDYIYALSWVGGLIQEIDWPTDPRGGDLTSIFPQIPSEVPVDGFLNTFSLRPSIEIAQQLDLYYCVHASWEHPELWEEDSNRSSLIIASIVTRREALEWCYNKKLSWSDIPLDT